QEEGTKFLSWKGFPGRIYYLLRSDDLEPGSLFPVIGSLPGVSAIEVEFDNRP
ncbi:MAG: hypothetical protein ACJAXZ_000092, partial [Akkermansiaceae bacterium]